MKQVFRGAICLLSKRTYGNMDGQADRKKSRESREVTWVQNLIGINSRQQLP